VNLLIDGGSLIDGKGVITENTWVAIKDKKIELVGSGAIPESIRNYSLLDVRGRTILSGLIDCHTHITMSADADPQAEAKKTKDMIILEAVANCRKTLFSGITTIRDMGSFEDIDIPLRDAVESELIIGPRIISSGRGICITGGHGWSSGAREADGVQEVRKAVREELKAGADNIKIFASGGVLTRGVEPISIQFSLDELKVAVEEATKAGKTVAAHSHPAQSIKQCILAGINCIQHAIFADDEAIEMMVQNNVCLSPTLMAPKQAFENPGLVPKWIAQKVKSVIPIHHQSALKAYQAGVKIVLGSDAGTPLVYHGNNLRELSELVGIGMSANEAIVAASRNAAEALGLDNLIGSVEAGKIADVIIVDGNPLDDITVLENQKNINIVIKEGKIIKNNLSSSLGYGEGNMGL